MQIDILALSGQYSLQAPSLVESERGSSLISLLYMSLK